MEAQRHILPEEFPPVGEHQALFITPNANVQYSLDGITWGALNTSLLFNVDNSGYALVKVKSHTPGTYTFAIAEQYKMTTLTAATETLNISTGYFIRVSPSASAGTVNAPEGSAFRVTAYVTDQNGIPQALVNIPVSFDSNFGSVSPQNGVTDATGKIFTDLTLSILSGVGHIVTASMTNPNGIYCV